MVKQGSNDDGDDASLEVCFQTSIGPPDDRSTFEKMEKALNKALEVSNSSDRDSPSSDGSMRSDVGKFMDMRSNSIGGSKQIGDDANQLAKAKTQALSMEKYVEGDELAASSTQHILSRLDDEDYVANMVADVRRRRSKKNVQQTYWQTYDSEDRELDGESAALYVDDEIDDSSSFSGSYYSDSEEENVMDELCGMFERQRRSSRRNRNGGIVGMMQNACSGEVCRGSTRDERRHSKTTRTQQGQRRKKSRRKRPTRREREARDFEEDTTFEFEGTVISGYTREDTTLGGTILSGSTREQTTIMSGSTKHVPEKPILLTEPMFLAEEEDDDVKNESTGDKAFGIIHNFCSGSWWFRDADKQPSQSETEGASGQKTKESVGGLSVKEHLNRTRSKLSVTQGLGESATLDVKESQYSKSNSNESMVNRIVITSPSQSELKAIYERNMVTSQLDASRTEDDDTVEISNRRQQTTSNAMGCESIKPTKAATTITSERTKKRFRPKLFSFAGKKHTTAAAASKIDARSTPVSPARTVATTGTSESRGSCDDEDDDVCASYAALGKTLISV